MGKAAVFFELNELDFKMVGAGDFISTQYGTEEEAVWFVSDYDGYLLAQNLMDPFEQIEADSTLELIRYFLEEFKHEEIRLMSTDLKEDQQRMLLIRRGNRRR